MPPKIADDLMRSALKALAAFGRSDLTDHPRVRRSSERILYEATRAGARVAGAMSRPFRAALRMARPERPAAVASPGLFDLTPTEEQAMIRDATARFAEDRIRPAAAEADAACRAPDGLLAEAAELGTVLMYVPEALGGAAVERSVTAGALAAESLAHGDMGLAVACLAPAGVAAALSTWGTAEQQATYLAAFAAEKPLFATTAFLEPGPLFDPRRLRTRASRAGDDWILEGTKALVPCAGEAELFLVGARTGDGPAFFLVEAGTEGLAIEGDPAMGLRAAATCRLILDGVRLPDSAHLGGEGGVDLSEWIARSRIAWSALAVGTAQAVLDYVIPYVNDRKAFGEPISHRQSVAFMVANIAIEIEGIRLLAWRAASRADQGLPFVREAALAKRACAEHGMRIGSDGVQLLGGHGYVKDHPVERWYRDLRSIGVMEGGLLL